MTLGARRTGRPGALVALGLLALALSTVVQVSPVVVANTCSSGTIFGNGSSGAATFSSSGSITSSQQYTSLTINAGITVTVSSGDTVKVCDTLTIGSGGELVAALVGTAGNGGGEAFASTSCEANSGHTTQNGVAPNGGSAGSGGAGNGGGSGGEGACTVTPSSTLYVALGGSGGPGGSGGLGGGTISVYAWTINNAGTISAGGGAGNAGGDAVDEGGVNYCTGDTGCAAGGGGGGNGGQGGAGGSLTIEYSLTTGSGLGTYNAVGGSGGAGGAGTSGAAQGTGCGSASGGGRGGSVGSSGGNCFGNDGGAGNTGGNGATGSTSVTQVTVVQPIIVTPANGASTSGTGTVSGCSVNSTSIKMDGAKHYFSAGIGCVLTITVPSDATHTRFRFSNSGSEATTTTVTTCASGTCTTSSQTVYLEQTATLTMTPGNPSTWDVSPSEPVKGEIVGMSGQTGCSVTLSNGGGSASCKAWFDYNQPYGSISSFAGSGSNTWVAQGTYTFTDASPTNHTVTYNEPSVNQPITITVSNSGPSGTATLSGCAVSPTTMAMDGNSHTVTATGSCTITVTVPTDGSNTRYRFSGPSTTETITTCGSGTCSSSSTTVYYQLLNTYAMTPGTSWDAAYMKPVTGTVLGVAGVTGCSVSMSNGGGSANCPAWFDYDLADSTPSSFASTATPTDSWVAQGTYGFASTTGGNTYTVTYDLVSPTVTQPITVTVSNSQASGTATLSGCSATPATLPMDGNSHTITATGSCTITVTVPSDGASSRYRFPGPATTFTVNTCSSGACSGASETVYFQYGPSLSYSAVNGSPAGNAVVFSYTYLGSSGTTYTLTGSATQEWVDAGTSFTVGDHYVSGTERYLQNQNGTMNSGSSIVFSVYHQFYLTVSYSAVSGSPAGNAVELIYHDLGSQTTYFLTTSGSSKWMDNAQPYSVGVYYPNPAQRYTQNQNGTVSSSTTVVFSIYDQWGETVSYSTPAGGSPSGNSLVFSYKQYGSPQTYTLTSSGVVKWVDDAQPYSVGDRYVSSVQRYSQDQNITSASSGGTVAFAIYRQFSVSNPDAMTLKPTQYGTSQSGTTATSVWNDRLGTLKAQNPMFTVSFNPDYSGDVYTETTGDFMLLTNVTASPVPVFDGSSVFSFGAVKANATVFVPFAYGVTSVTDNANTVTYSSLGSGLIQFTGSSSFAVNVYVSGGGNGGSVTPTGTSNNVVTVTGSTTSSTYQGQPPLQPITNNPIPPGQFALVIIGVIGALAALYVYSRRDELTDTRKVSKAIGRGSVPRRLDVRRRDDED
jgi:hypothetical protein